jgi:ABC-2 type transport system permease protein
MPPAIYFAAKVIMSMIFSAEVVLLLMLLGSIFGGVQMPLVDFAKLLGVLVAGSIPFCAMGLAIGYFVGPNSAPPTINMIYLPMSFCSGLWVPLMFLPRLLRQFAEFLPSYHLSQLALGIVGAGSGEPNWKHWQVLIAFTLICLGIARIGFQRDEGKMYG